MTRFMRERRAALFSQYEGEEKCVKSLAGNPDPGRPQRPPMKSGRRLTAEPGVSWADLLLALVRYFLGPNPRRADAVCRLLRGAASYRNF